MGAEVANVTRRRTGEFLRKLFELLIAEPDGLKAGPVIAQVAAASNLTEWERGEYPSGGLRFEKVLRFATIDCVKAGWLQKSKGVWRLTEAGQKAYAKYKDPESFYTEACRLYAAWKRERDAVIGPATPQETDEQIEVGAEKLSFTFEEAEEQAWSQIERYLQTSDPFQFQDIVADLLAAMGYHVSWVSPPGKDGGVDIIAHTDPLGAQGPRIKVQVKRTQSKISSDGLKAFIATINSGDVGIYVCLAGFTKDAEDYARNQETRRVKLIDAREFVDLWVDHYDKLDEEAHQRLPLIPIYFLAPKE
jgi:restriction system protein